MVHFPEAVFLPQSTTASVSMMQSARHLQFTKHIDVYYILLTSVLLSAVCLYVQLFEEAWLGT